MAYTPNNPNGQATSANSEPVVLSTEQEAKIDLLATKAKQDLLLTELQLKADLTETQPVSVASLPLPTGAATSANQTTEITALQILDDAIVTDNAGFTDGTTKVNMGGYIYDEVAGTALTENDAAAARINVNRAQIGIIEDGVTRGRYATVSAANALKVDGSAVIQPVSIAATVNTSSAPATSGGLTTFHLVSAATTNATNIKASAGQVYGWYIYNSNAAARKVAFHNTAGTPTAGASIFFTLVIPATSGANVEMSNGIVFSTGIAITTVTDLTDAGATAVALNDLNINIFYK
jgi:hypothetical protein